jgi:hypothetical protein
MNPLDVIRNMIAQPSQNVNGTVVGMQGSLVQLRTAQGIQLVNTTKFCAQGSSVTVDTKGNVVSVVDSDDSIPTYRV